MSEVNNDFIFHSKLKLNNFINKESVLFSIIQVLFTKFSKNRKIVIFYDLGKKTRTRFVCSNFDGNISD